MAGKVCILYIPVDVLQDVVGSRIATVVDEW